MSNTGYLPIIKRPLEIDLSGNIQISTNLFKPVKTFFLESDTIIDESVRPRYIYKDSFISLNQPLPRIQKIVESLILKKRDRIILTDETKKGLYANYESDVIYILQELNKNFKNIYLHNELYLNDIIQNARKYKGLIRGIYIKIYGSCSDSSNNKLIDLYAYTIDKKILQNNVKMLKQENIDLVVQTNSSCKYNSQISNTYGSQLWLLDFLFKTSMCGIDSVVIESNDKNNIYAYKIFNDIASFDSNLYEGTIPFIMLGVSTYINKNNDNGETVIIINKSADNIQLSITLDTEYEGKLYIFNTIESHDTTTGIHYGKITYNTGAPIHMRTKKVNTRLSSNNSIKPKGKTYIFNVAKNTVCIMKAPFNKQSGGEMRIPINKEDVGKALVTVRVNPLEEGPDAAYTQMTVEDYNKLMEYY